MVMVRCKGSDEGRGHAWSGHGAERACTVCGANAGSSLPGYTPQERAHARLSFFPTDEQRTWWDGCPALKNDCKGDIGRPGEPKECDWWDGKRDVSTEKLKIAAYMMERLAAGEMMVARLTYTHTYGVAQRLVQFSMEHGKVNARGLLYPTDVMDNDYPNAAVATLKLSEAERKVLSALWAKEAITPEDNISAEIQSTLAQADGGIVVSAQPEMPTEATLIEMLAAAGVPEATA